MVDGTPFSSTNVAPYTGTWSNITVGSHNLTARATDNQGAQTTSAPVAITVTVNSPPTVSLTAPQTGAQYQPPATIAFAATAADSDGTVAKVEFLLNGAVVGSATAAPYAFTAINIAAGSYTAAARAIDNDGAATTSTGVTVTVAVNQPPVVSITSPTSGASFTAPVDVTFTASATDSDGSVAKVELFVGTTLLRTLTAAPYSTIWRNPLPGSYVLTARATDDRGATTTSTGVPITVGGTSVQITAPADGASFPAPASFTLQATAATTGANVTKLEFFDGTTLLTTLNGNAPSLAASLGLTGVVAGSHVYTVKATTSTGTTVTSAPVSVNILAAATVQLSTLSNYYLAPAAIDLNANVTAAAGTTIAKVEFFSGGNLIATVSSPPYSFRVPNTPVGNYTFTAKVTDSQAFTVASNPVSVTVGNGVTLTLSSGLNGSTVNNDDSVFVSGTAQAPPNSAISVNGQLATITADGQFFANAVALTEGANIITATLTAPDGETATQSASVTRTVNGGLPPAGSEPTPIDFRVTVSPTEGIIIAGDTFPVTITIESPANKPFASMTLSCSAPAPGSAVGLGTYGCGYTSPGRYTIVVEVKDAMGAVIYTKSNTVVVRSAQQHIAGVKAVYTDVIDRLKAGNKVGALKLFFGNSQEKYDDIFTKLGTDLVVFAGQLGSIATTNALSNAAEITIARDVAGTKQFFTIYLMRGDDGVWRIDSM